MIDCEKLMENQVKRKMEKHRQLNFWKKKKMINPWNDEIIIED